ncbi:MAG: glycosyl hydrolase family 18 protein [bacterium]
MFKKLIFIFFIAISLNIPLSANAAVPANFTISAWIPYWAKTAGTKSATDHLKYFNELHPFSFEVQPDGTIIDRMKLDQTPYKELIQTAKKNNVKIIPTFLWTGPTAMKNTFSDTVKTQTHINKIIELAQKINASGVDIDYEGKRMEDKALYASFFEKLSKALHAKNLTLSCTIQAASTATPPARLITFKATAPWSDDLAKMNKYCDTIRIMAYDQMPQTTTSTWTEKTDKKPYAPNSDIVWVRKVLDYNLKYIDKSKLILGIPTYGWDTQYTKLKTGGYSYEVMKSMAFETGMQLAKDNKVKPTRDASGGLSFTYVKNGTNRVVYLADATSVQYAYEEAKRRKIKGVTLFKIDGGEDQQIWNILGR